MKKNILSFVRDFFIMLLIILIVDFAFYKLKFLESINFEFIIGFMIGWSIWQIVKMIIDAKKKK